MSTCHFTFVETAGSLHFRPLPQPAEIEASVPPCEGERTTYYGRLCWYCTGTLLVMVMYCTGTVLVLYCTGTVLVLYWESTVLYWYCTCISTGTVLGLSVLVILVL